MQTEKTLQALIAGCSFNDWDLLLKFNKEVPYFQIKFQAPCNMTGEMSTQSCRKWMLSLHMCDEEVVNTVYKAVEAAVMHEMREQFKWNDQPIYRPHVDIHILHELSSTNPIDKRDEPFETHDFGKRGVSSMEDIGRSGYDIFGGAR